MNTNYSSIRQKGFFSLGIGLALLTVFSGIAISTHKGNDKTKANEIYQTIDSGELKQQGNNTEIHRKQY